MSYRARAASYPWGEKGASELLHGAERLLTRRRRPPKNVVMPFARVRVSLLPARDEPRIDSGSLQSAFGKFLQFLRISGVAVSTPMFYAEAHPTAEGYVGEFILPLAQALRPPLAMIVSAWLQQRPGRAVRLRIGESCAVARSTEQAERFLSRARQLRTAPSPSREIRS